VGIRPGEKLHEEMITETDAYNTIEFDGYFVILPSMRLWDVEAFIRQFKGRHCPPGFKYSSATNTEWLSVEQLRDFIATHVRAKQSEMQGEPLSWTRPSSPMAASD
jgi:FlaA1/EpsC-like NDP-sugar epimerase